MKKFASIVLIALLTLSMCFALVACGCDDGSRSQGQSDNKGTADDAYTIVYVGDSIAEALIGPSPLSERDNYGYFALVGRINNFKYYNHAVSGHKTSGGMIGEDKDGLLEMLNRDDENAVLMKTHLQEADMIHVSVLGNNMLQYNLGLLLLEVADPDFEDNYEAGTSLINALEDGGTMTRTDVDGQTVEFSFPPTYQNICDIVARLRELNPDAQLVFQKVYNPLYEGSSHLKPEVIEELRKDKYIDTKGQFGAAGERIDSIEKIRRVANKLLSQLNGILDRYLAEHNSDEFIILDAQAEFERVTRLGVDENGDLNLSGDSLGRSLIFADWTHPSNFGHAVLAGLTQKMLDTLKLSSPDALANYKEIRVEQIKRLYSPIKGFDKNAAVSSINSATTFFDVTMAYFTAIDGYTPIY